MSRAKLSEFQAVILAGGRGSRMTDLTYSKPKCLLPIGSVPLIWFPLNTLKELGLNDVFIVCQESTKAELQNVTKKFSTEMNLDVVTLPHGGEDVGTADALRHVHDRLTANRIIVISSDLVTDFPVRRLTDLHRIHRSSVTALFSRNPRPHPVCVPGPKTKFKKEPKDLIGIDHQLAGDQLCFLTNEADLDDLVSVSKTVLREHPRLSIHSDLTDAHLYVFDRWVCDFIKSEGRFSSIKGEVLPHLVNKQFSRKNVFKSNNINDASGYREAIDETPKPKLAAGDEVKLGIEYFLRKMDLTHQQAQRLSSWNEDPGGLLPSYKNRLLRCYACIVPNDDDGSFCTRANTMPSYCQLNGKADVLLSRLSAAVAAIHPGSKVDPKSQLHGSRCFVGEGTEISDKTTIRNSVIGTNCFIEPKVRLTDCVIMDNVRIKSMSNVQGSYVCDGCVIGERCEVKDSIVGKGQEMGDGQKHANEIIASDESRMMMEI